jgi:hypothetical protein
MSEYTPDTAEYPEGQGDPQVREGALASMDAVPNDGGGDSGVVHEQEITDTVTADDEA